MVLADRFDRRALYAVAAGSARGAAEAYVGESDDVGRRRELVDVDVALVRRGALGGHQPRLMAQDDARFRRADGTAEQARVARVGPGGELFRRRRVGATPETGR